MTQLPHFQLYIDGEFTEGHDTQVMTTQNPATGEDWATFSCAAPQDVDRAVTAARRVLGHRVHSATRTDWRWNRKASWVSDRLWV